MVCGKDKKPSFEHRTVFLHEMMAHGIMMPYIAIAYQHTESEIEQTLEAAEKSAKVLSDALNGDVCAYINGNIIKPVFRKYN